jgi:hypothetical protein
MAEKKKEGTLEVEGEERRAEEERKDRKQELEGGGRNVREGSEVEEGGKRREPRQVGDREAEWQKKEGTKADGRKGWKNGSRMKNGRQQEEWRKKAGTEADRGRGGRMTEEGKEAGDSWR